MDEWTLEDIKAMLRKGAHERGYTIPEWEISIMAKRAQGLTHEEIAYQEGCRRETVGRVIVRNARLWRLEV